MLAVPRYNKRMLKEKLPEVKMILSKFSYPYNRRIAGAHGNFSKQDHKKWLKEADKESLAQTLRRLAQLNQTKVFEFFLFHLNFASLSFSFSRSSKCYYYGYS